MKILIIEDELPASQQLSQVIKAFDPGVEILAILDSNQAIKHWFATNEEQPDLIFSDIELLDGNVFNVLSKLNLEIPIIFTTAYHQFTMEAFETSGIAYLLKPVEPKAVQKAMAKYQHLTKAGAINVQELLSQLQIGYGEAYKTRFSIKVGQGIYLLKTEDIACLTMKNGVLHAFKENGKSFLMSINLNEAYQQLNPSSFHLLNRSDVVNIDAIDRVEHYTNDRLAVFVKGQKEPFITSTSKTSSFRKWLDGN